MRVLITIIKVVFIIACLLGYCWLCRELGWEVGEEIGEDRYGIPRYEHKGDCGTELVSIAGFWLLFIFLVKVLFPTSDSESGWGGDIY